MNFNANAGARLPAQGQSGAGLGRKVKRVSDVNAVGPSVPTSQFAPTSTVNPNYYGIDPGFNNGVTAPLNQNYGYPPNVPSPAPQFPQQQQYAPQQQQYAPQQQQYAPQQQQFQSFQNVPAQTAGGPPGNQNTFNPDGIPLQSQQQFAMFQQPIVQDMAMQYGQRLADQGKQLVENQFEKWIPVSRLRYYFAVDNNYVINKLRLLFFPFIHSDWSMKYDQNNPVQPRYDINAPDLYIPTMAYITYVVVAGLMLGMQKRFSPEQLGIQASSALAYMIFELVIYSIVTYVANITTNLKTLDLVAFAGYKFVIIVASILTSIVFHSFGYYCALIYSTFALGFYLLRALKTIVLRDSQQTTPGGGIDYYGNPPDQQIDQSIGRKRRHYFLFLVVGCQAFFAFMLSKHLILVGSENERFSAEF